MERITVNKCYETYKSVFVHRIDTDMLTEPKPGIQTMEDLHCVRELCTIM